MLIYLSSLFAGLLFGLGLILSGMANPAKVLGFLDITGRWDPSLLLVMAGAIAVGLPVFTFGKKKTASLIGEPLRLPTSRDIDRRLVLGSVVFGIGWGLAGYCPGPALVSLFLGVKPLVFVAAMIVGMAIYEFLTSRTWGAGR
ncbi:MAG TPA: DUF6691 family protein [Methylophilaceae bacterium]|nr:DUF6691 family protein [Methylophilaceae bacterium]